MVALPLLLEANTIVDILWELIIRSLQTHDKSIYA